MTPPQARARAIVEQLKADVTLMRDTQTGWFLVKEHELLDAIAAALEAQRTESFNEAIDIVMQSKNIESILTLLRAKAGLINLKAAAIRQQGGQDE